MNVKEYMRVARISKDNENNIDTDSFNIKQLRYVNKFLKDLISMGNDCRIAIYGTGKHSEKLYSYLKDNSYNVGNVKCFIAPDNDNCIGSELLGKEILILSKAVEKYKINTIVISSYKYEEVIYNRVKAHVDENINIMKIYGVLLDDALERLVLHPNIDDSQIGDYGELYYEHLNRYFWSIGYAKDKVVLDIACGVGYGSDILSEKAKYVIGVDIDDEAIETAKSNYKKQNLCFKQENIETFSYKDKFDLITSFETIEHIKNGRIFFDMVSRNLKEDGTLIVSTPVSDFSGMSRLNKYHINQYTVNDFKDELQQYFSEILMYRQDPGGGGAIAIDDGDMNDSVYDETFMIAVCSGLKKN